MFQDPGQIMEFLGQAGRLLLEFNESTGAIHRALSSTSRVLTDSDPDVHAHPDHSRRLPLPVKSAAHQPICATPAAGAGKLIEERYGLAVSYPVLREVIEI